MNHDAGLGTDGIAISVWFDHQDTHGWKGFTNPPGSLETEVSLFVDAFKHIETF